MARTSPTLVGDKAAGDAAASLAARIRIFRRERGWTQAQLASRSGVAATTISRIERGDERPHGETVRKLATGLHVDADRLLGLEGQPGLFPSPEQQRLELIRQVMGLTDDQLVRGQHGIEDALALARRPPSGARRSRK